MPEYRRVLTNDCVCVYIYVCGNVRYHGIKLDTTPLELGFEFHYRTKAGDDGPTILTQRANTTLRRMNIDDIVVS